MFRRFEIVFLLLIGLAVSSSGAAQSLPIAPEKIDDTVARAMTTFEVPGMAIGIVKDGKLIYAKGYGVREIGKSGPVDPETLFQIGSNSKAFTTAALAILVDEGRIRWDDTVIDYLPQFQMYDPCVTREITIRDLLTHRSGLPLGAGDLMFVPETDFTRSEIIRAVRYLKPVSSFRSKYAYDNLLYMVAGEIIPAVTHQNWEEFVETRIFNPLGMQACAATFQRIKDKKNIAIPHSIVDGKLTHLEVEDLSVIGPAGSIGCSINGMSEWLITQLNAGKAPTGVQLFSKERRDEMWTVNTVLPINSELAGLTKTNFSGYGLGWELQDEFGYKRVSHTGGVPGSVTWVTMIPELNLGILVFTNQESSVAMEAVGNQILDAYVGAPKRDWVSLATAYIDRHTAQSKRVEAQVANDLAKAGPPALPLEAYVGRYHDAWRGDATIQKNGDTLVLKFSRTDRLEGKLVPYSGNIFVVHWNDRSLNADAFVRFSQAYSGGVEGMTMRAVSPRTDFSFDFHDLNFRKVDADKK